MKNLLKSKSAFFVSMLALACMFNFAVAPAALAHGGHGGGGHGHGGHGHHHCHHCGGAGFGPGLVFGAAAAGLMIGAAVASSQPAYYDGGSNCHWRGPLRCHIDSWGNTYCHHAHRVLICN